METTSIKPEPHRGSHRSEVGFVVGVKHYLIVLEGLPSARTEDVLIHENGGRAVVLSLAQNHIKAIVLDPVMVRPGERFYLYTGKNFFSFGSHLFGRVINALGEPIDGKKAFPEPNTPFQIDTEAPGMHARAAITEQLITGITMIDILLPIAQGQRQLVFGPLSSGKATFVEDIITNQRAKEIVCMYAAIGKPLSVMQALIERILKEEEEASKTIVISTPSNAGAPLIAITPSVAMSVAEFFQKQGHDVLLIFDDLATHAKYVREIALLQGRLPGRESYPGDIFYEHAHTIERAGKFGEAAGGGSITLLPLLEVEVEGYSDLIPTNLMASTDGHLSFSAPLHAEGMYPALGEEESVTRVGKNTQTLIQKQLAEKILILLAEFRKEQEYVQFGAPVSERTKKILLQGELAYIALRQEPNDPIPLSAQILLGALIFTSFLSEKGPAFFRTNKQKLVRAFKEHEGFEELRTRITDGATLTQISNMLEEKNELLETVSRS